MARRKSRHLVAPFSAEPISAEPFSPLSSAPTRKSQKPEPSELPFYQGSDSHHHAVACLAARLMAVDGLTDYGQAKRKAAKQLGLSDRDGLPSNEAIADELRTYQALLQSEETPQRVAELRRIALQVMRELAEFRPYLTGAVLAGIAGRYSEIEIDLFPDSAKDVEIYLLSHDICYEIADKRPNSSSKPETRLRLDWFDASVLISVYPTMALRSGKRLSPGQVSLRADVAEVSKLLAK